MSAGADNSRGVGNTVAVLEQGVGSTTRRGTAFHSEMHVTFETLVRAGGLRYSAYGACAMARSTEPRCAVGTVVLHRESSHPI